MTIPPAEAFGGLSRANSTTEPWPPRRQRARSSIDQRSWQGSMRSSRRGLRMPTACWHSQSSSTESHFLNLFSRCQSSKRLRARCLAARTPRSCASQVSSTSRWRAEHLISKQRPIGSSSIGSGLEFPIASVPKRAKHRLTASMS